MSKDNNKKCLTCGHAYNIANEMCKCKIEPCYHNDHYIDYYCSNYEKAPEQWVRERIK